MKEFKLFINGEWVNSTGKEKIMVENPATKEIIAVVPDGNVNDIDKAVDACKDALKSWAASPKKRAECLYRLADYFENHEEEIARVITMELGAPVKMCRDWHVSSAKDETRYYADAAKNFIYEKKENEYILRREPYGIVAGLTPWNCPLDQITLKILPALAAGNCVILKPSQMTPLTAICFAKGIEKAGFPKGVFNLITGRGSGIGNLLSEHPDIRMISFTGSTYVGKNVAKISLRDIKKCILELGGKSASIVLESANLEEAVNSILWDCFRNNGETSNAITRMLIPENKKVEIEKIIIEKYKEYVVGDPTNPNTDIGPLINEKSFYKVKWYIEKGLDEGATMLCGEVPDNCDNGYYVKPVVFTNVVNSMTIAQEEIFGPVLSVITYKNIDEAIEIANDSQYGLCGGVFGEELEAVEVARKMETGSIHINNAYFPIGASFGGYKQSGVGRENSMETFKEYLEIKAISL